MQQLTGQQQEIRSTGRKYRLFTANEGWGKTTTLAYDALWYARFANKRILVITPNTSEFNLALSQFALQEHDTSEIVVTTDYQQGDWFMVIVDQAEAWTESDLKDLIRKIDSKMLWIASRPLSKQHWLSELMADKRRDRRTKNVDWWVVEGQAYDNYTKIQGESRTYEEIAIGLTAD